MDGTKRCLRNIKFLKPYPVVAADALLEIDTAVISAVLSLDEHLSQTNTSCVPKLCYQSVYCCLIRYFLFRMRHEHQQTVSMRSNVREWIHILLVNTVLRNWSEQRPSNQGYLDSSITGEAGRVCYSRVDLLLISPSYRSTWLLLGCVGTLCTMGLVEINKPEGKPKETTWKREACYTWAEILTRVLQRVIHGRKILTRVLQRVWERGVDSCGLIQGPVTGSCQPSGYIRGIWEEARCATVSLSMFLHHELTDLLQLMVHSSDITNARRVRKLVQ
jgi:hypothetical protein